MRKLIFIIFLFLLLFLPYNKVVAMEDNIIIENLSIDAVIHENGDVSVKEIMDCKFYDNVYTFFRNLKNQKCDGYKVTNVYTKDTKNNYLKIYPGNANTCNTFSVINSQDNTKIEVYSDTNIDKKTFIFEYTILNAAKQVNNLGRFIFDFYDVSVNKPIQNLDLTISLEGSKFDPNCSKFRITSRGSNLNTYETNEFVNFTGNDITSIVGIDLSFKPTYLNVSNNDLNIFKTEQSITIIIIIFLVILTIIVSIISIVKHKKNKSQVSYYRTNYEFINEKFLKSPPKDISPAIINFIINKNKKVTYFTIAACILYLCDKEYFSVYKLNTNDKLNFKNRTYKDTIFFKATNKSSAPLDKHLKFLLRSIYTYSNNGTFTLDIIEQTLKTKIGTNKFKRWFNKFSDLLEEDSSRYISYKNIGNDIILSNESLNEKLQWLAYRNFLKTYFLHEKHNLKLFNTYNFIIYALAFELSEKYISLFWNNLNTTENWTSSNIFKDILVKIYIWHHIHIKTNSILKMGIHI